MSYIRSIQRLATRPPEQHPEVQKFDKNMVIHERFSRSLMAIAENIQYGSNNCITAVIGPTGAGKSALKDEFAYQFQKATSDLPRETCPTVLVMNLEAPERGPFNWRDDLYRPALMALNEPCIDRKIDIEGVRRRMRDGDTRQAYGKSNQTITEYRGEFLSALDRCRVTAVLLDEAGHLRRPAGKNGIFASYDSLKSRSDGTRAHFALLGAVELADIFRQSGQISKRVAPVWMSPYLPAERGAFLSGLESIQQKLDRPMSFSLQEKVDEIQAHVYGGFGLAHDWIRKALVKTIEKQGKHISWNCMCEARYHDIQRSGISTELARYYTVESELQDSLATQTMFVFGVGTARAGSTAPRQKRTGNLRPGVRKPKRDKVE